MRSRESEIPRVVPRKSKSIIRFAPNSGEDGMAPVPSGIMTMNCCNRRAVWARTRGLM